VAKGNLYSAYKAAGSAAGKYQGSWHKQEGIRGEMTAESMLSDLKVQGIQDTTAAITEAIGLAQSYRDERRAEKEHKELMGALGDDSTKGAESLSPDTTVASAQEDIAGDLDVSDTSGFDFFEDPTTGTTGTTGSAYPPLPKDIVKGGKTMASEVGLSGKGWAGGQTGGTAEENISARKWMGMEKDQWSNLPQEERFDIWSRMNLAGEGREGLEKYRAANE
tara:strand:- start:57 stop:719 length:663 start_codon:yes stop_codon:yes gene_type:complete